MTLYSSLQRQRCFSWTLLASIIKKLELLPHALRASDRYFAWAGETTAGWLWNVRILM